MSTVRLSQITVKQDIDKMVRMLGVERRQVNYVTRRALNETAKRMVEAGRAETARVFDRPLKRTVEAIKVFKGATKDDLSVTVNIHDGQKGYDISDPRAMASGKSSVMPNRYLAAQVYGGQRDNKRFENALIKAGVMPPGMQAVFATRSGYLDQHGNLSGARINQILSWFQAFPEMGYRANMTRRSKARLMKPTKRRAGSKPKASDRKYGISYFVTVGGRAGGLRMRVPDGIYERNYPNGPEGKSFIKPILLFIHPGNYRQRLDFFALMGRTADKEFPIQFEKAAALAAQTAR